MTTELDEARLGEAIASKLAAAARRAKEHRRQLRQMNKAIERYRASYVEQVHRNALEKEHATLRDREFDSKLHQVRENWGIAEAHKRTLEHENKQLRAERDALRESERRQASVNQDFQRLVVSLEEERDALLRDRERLVEALRPLAAAPLAHFDPHGDCYVSLEAVYAARALLAELDAAGEQS